MKNVEEFITFQILVWLQVCGCHAHVLHIVWIIPKMHVLKYMHKLMQR